MNKHQISFWAQVLSAPVSIAVYFALVSSEFSKPMAQYDLVAPLAWAIGAGVGVSVIASTLLSAAFSKGLKLKITDERDTKIHRLGEFYTQGFYVIGGVVALGLAAFRFDHFYIATSLLIFFSLASAVGSAAKLIMYRFGVTE